MTPTGLGWIKFDVTLHVGDTCPLDYHVDPTVTALYVGECGTSATMIFHDQALLTLARVTRDAVHAALSLRDAPCRENTSDMPDRLPSRAEIRTDTIVTVTDPCPISFALDGELASILVPDDTTLRLTFHRRGLLTFAQLTCDAAAAMLHTRKSTTPVDEASPAMRPEAPGLT